MTFLVFCFTRAVQLFPQLLLYHITRAVLLVPNCFSLIRLQNNEALQLWDTQQMVFVSNHLVVLLLGHRHFLILFLVLLFPFLNRLVICNFLFLGQTTTLPPGRRKPPMSEKVGNVTETACSPTQPAATDLSSSSVDVFPRLGAGVETGSMYVPLFQLSPDVLVKSSVPTYYYCQAQSSGTLASSLPRFRQARLPPFISQAQAQKE